MKQTLQLQGATPYTDKTLHAGVTYAVRMKRPSLDFTGVFEGYIEETLQARFTGLSEISQDVAGATFNVYTGDIIYAWVWEDPRQLPERSVDCCGGEDWARCPQCPDKHTHAPVTETDPSDISANTPGAKLDAGKVYVDAILAGFPHALWGVAEVGTFGANKYSLNGWKEVEDGIRRYRDAAGRHKLKRQMGELIDEDSGLLHQYHEVWNHLAALELYLREHKEGEQFKDI